MIRNTFLSLLGLFLAGTANADWALNMPEGVTDLSVETYNLHMMVFWWCVAIGAVVVFGVMIISLIKHRKSKGAEPATFSHSTTAEVIWTAIPVIILDSYFGTDGRNDGEDGRLSRPRSVDRGHRLSMEVALQVSGQECRVSTPAWLGRASRLAASNPESIPSPSITTCLKSTTRSLFPRGSEGSTVVHIKRCHSLLVGHRSGHQEGRYTRHR